MIIKKEQITKQTKAFRYISVITNVNERLLLSQKKQSTIFRQIPLKYFRLMPFYIV